MNYLTAMLIWGVCFIVAIPLSWCLGVYNLWYIVIFFAGYFVFWLFGLVEALKKDRKLKLLKGGKN